MFRVGINKHRLVVRLDGVQFVYDIFIDDKEATAIKSRSTKYMFLEDLLQALNPGGKTPPNPTPPKVE